MKEIRVMSNLSSRRPRRGMAMAVAAAIATALCGPVPARAEALRDPQWQALADAHRFLDLEQVGAARLGVRPEDGDAWRAFILGVVRQRGPGAEAHREAALARLEACVAKTPQMAACHYGIGAVRGVQAISEGFVKAAFGVSRIRDAFVKALEIDPAFFDARSGLVQYYLYVPGIAGGSVAKARDTAQAAAARQPEHAKLLNAVILQYEDKLPEAERVLAAVQPGTDRELVDELRDRWLGLGFDWLQHKEPAKARAIFERVAKDKPDEAQAHYGLARALADDQQWDASIAALERAAALPGHDELPIDYRLGLAWQAKGDPVRARAAFIRYVGSSEPNPHNLEDARKRLADLG
jgi:tetratricopeptide (TPR) repeat protein